MFKISSLP